MSCRHGHNWILRYRGIDSSDIQTPKWMCEAGHNHMHSAASKRKFREGNIRGSYSKSYQKPEYWKGVKRILISLNGNLAINGSVTLLSIGPTRWHCEYMAVCLGHLLRALASEARRLEEGQRLSAALGRRVDTPRQCCGSACQWREQSDCLFFKMCDSKGRATQTV